MNDYRQRRQTFAAETQQLTALAMETYQTRSAAAAKLDARDVESRNARERRHARAERLHQRMVYLSGSESSLSLADRPTVFLMSSYLQHKIEDFDDNPIQNADFDNVCNLFASYFGQNADQDRQNTLLNALRGSHYEDIQLYFDTALVRMQQPAPQQEVQLQLNGPHQEVQQEQANPNIIQIPS